MACQHGWDSVGLNGGRVFVSTERDVLQHDRVQASFLELEQVSFCSGANKGSTHVDDGLNTSLGLNDDLDSNEAGWLAGCQNNSV